MGVRQLLSSVKNRAEGSSFEIWEEADGTIASYQNGAPTVTATTDPVTGVISKLLAGGVDVLQSLGQFGLRTVLFGHSYADNEDVSGTYALNAFNSLGGFHWANALGGRRLNIVKGAGVGGERVRDVLQRYDVHVAPYAPDVICLAVGHNDLNAVVNGGNQLDTNIPYVADSKQSQLPYLMDGINSLLDKIPGNVLVIITAETQPGPNQAGTKSSSCHKQLGQRFANLNRALSQLALSRKNVVFIPVDLVSINPSDTDVCTATGEYTDQVHPSTLASYKRGKMINAYLDRIFPPMYAPLPFSVGEVFLNQRLPFTAISGDGSAVTITMDNSAPGNHATIGRLKVGDKVVVQCPNDTTWSFTSTITDATLTYIKVSSTVTGTTNTGHVCACPQMAENPVFTVQTGGSKHANITLSSGALPGGWSLQTQAGAGVVSVTVTYEAHTSADGFSSSGYWVVLDFTTTGSADIQLQQGVSDQSAGSYHRRFNIGDSIYSGCEVDISGTISNFNGVELRNYIGRSTTDVITADMYRGADTSPWPQSAMRLTLMTPTAQIPAAMTSVTPQLWMRFSAAGTAKVKIARFGSYRDDALLNAEKLAVQ